MATAQPGSKKKEAEAFFEETLRIDLFHLNCKILLEEIKEE